MRGAGAVGEGEDRRVQRRGVSVEGGGVASGFGGAGGFGGEGEGARWGWG